MLTAPPSTTCAPSMQITNIVVSGDLNQPLPFTRLPKLPARAYTYNPKTYHGAYILLAKGKATIYRSGKYIIYGLASPDDLAYKEFLAPLPPPPPPPPPPPLPPPPPPPLPHIPPLPGRVDIPA
ncbi:MAG: hypothetical protein RQM90_01170 [Methanoculleus sp.]